MDGLGAGCFRLGVVLGRRDGSYCRRSLVYEPLFSSSGLFLGSANNNVSVLTLTARTKIEHQFSIEKDKALLLLASP